MPPTGAVFIPPASRELIEIMPGGRKSAPKGRHNPQSGGGEPFAVAEPEAKLTDTATVPVTATATV
jgi:hypothetical protein